jgi:hypothetical protein
MSVHTDLSSRAWTREQELYQQMIMTRIRIWMGSFKHSVLRSEKRVKEKKRNLTVTATNTSVSVVSCSFLGSCPSLLVAFLESPSWGFPLPLSSVGPVSRTTFFNLWGSVKTERTGFLV